MKRKTVKTTNYKEYEIYEDGTCIPIGEKNTTETEILEGSFFEDEMLKRQKLGK